MDGQSLSLVLSIFSILVASFGAYTSWAFNQKSIRKSSRIEHNTLFLSIDHLLLQHPELWSIYDDHPLASKKSLEPLDVAKREAFLLIFFNTLEIIFDFYNNIGGQNKDDSEAWIAWQGTIRTLFSGSKEARILFKKFQDEYSTRFAEFVNKIISEH